MSKKALIAMSGGVDSSVAAFLTQSEGYDCAGAIMKLFEKHQGESNDIDDARSVCQKLGIDFSVLDFCTQFEETVIKSFVKSYEDGYTPNPCIECNRIFKFGRFLEEAEKLGMDYIVTGHYARIEKNGNRFLLKKGMDVAKDQSYVLYNMTQHQLAHTLFPLGEMTKPEIRSIAERHNLVNARKKDSQDICFVPDGDYVSVIKSRTGKEYPQGDFVSKKGEIIGTHSGIINYTIGQRKGLGCAFGEKMYVCDKDARANTVILGKNDDLFSKTVNACDVNMIASDALPQTFKASARIRYNSKESPATVFQTGKDTITVEFDTPQRAPAKGQSLVIYDGDLVIGGGVIC
ncbi:MAG: tRNA 2-thiouridine(34) synthase MnmA [Clostridia bacterium]|nr:tRNA 2-thiouridine(34) synthase MnmA [Clostridia bacterium]